jgi:hypothetical protein
MEKYRKILQKDREEQGDAHELLTSSCDDSRARLVRIAVYGIREVRASERVSERVSRVVRVSTRGWLFIGQSAQLRAIKNATVAHGRCLICMHDACKWTVSNHRVLACRCMQMDGACCPACMHEIYHVCVHCYIFLHVSLLVFVVIYVRKKYGWSRWRYYRAQIIL